MKKRKKFRRRASIELVIGHLKKLMQELVKKKSKAIFVFILELKNGFIFYTKNLNMDLLFIL